MSQVTDKYSMSKLTNFGESKKKAAQVEIFDHFLPKLSNDSHVLEIGPGRGAFARECQRREIPYTGIEPSDSLRAELSADGINVVKSSVPPIDLKGDEFDLVYSFHIVEHMKDYHDVMEFFAEAYRVLKPGGYMAVIAPNYRLVKNVFFQYEYQHAFVTTLDNVSNGLKDTGFDIEDAKCYLTWLNPKKRVFDRIVANVCVPIGTNLYVENILRTAISPNFLFKVHKNLFDNIAVLARKPK